MSIRKSIEWINNLPVNWSAVQLKYLLASENGAMKVGPFGTQLSGNDFTDEGYWVYNQRTVVNQNFEDNTTFISEEKYNSMKGFQVEADDILITSRGTIGKICRVPQSFHKGIIHPCIIKFRIDDSKILYSIVRLLFNESDIIKEQLLYMSNATTIDVVYSSSLKNVFLPVAPIKMQHQISSYLDAKCTEIDSLSADIQSQIDTLEQYKRSVITEAVTKGLDKNVEMKDSGITYVGKIPSLWNIHPIYYYFSERKNKNRLGQEQNLLSLSYGKIIEKDINTNEGLLPESFNTYNIVEPGDIIIRPTDLQNDQRSLRTGLVKEHGIITSAYLDLMPIREINTEYYHYLLHAFDVMKVFYNMGNGVRQGLNFSEFSRLMVFEPSLAEQNAIVDYLNDKCAQIDTVISEKQKQLSTLDAYKKSLIYEYVTGKKEVPVS
jgi:type I restriction enzyme S subunit